MIWILIIISLLSLILRIQADIDVLPNGEIEIFKQKECCYEKFPKLSKFLSKELNIHNKCWDIHILNETSLHEICRNDGHFTFYEFDPQIDRINMRKINYNFTDRYSRIAKQYFNVSVPFKNYLTRQSSSNSSCYACGDLVPETSRVPATKICSNPVSNVVFQTRITGEESIFHVLQGRIYLLITPPWNISTLHSFPSIHPFRFQSQLNFSNLDHQQQSWNNKIPVYLVEIDSGSTFKVPSYFGYRQYIEQNTVWLVERKTNNIYWKSRYLTAQSLPRMFQPNALSEQPLFFGLWALASYGDSLFNFANDSQRVQFKELYGLVNRRWNKTISVLNGHADDDEDFATDAMEIMTNIQEECEELKKTPKDLTLTNRAAILLEINTAAQIVRNTFIQSEKMNSPIYLEMMMDHFETAITHVFGAVGVRTFLSCYFGVIL